MTKIVFPQVQHGYKLENMKSAAFPHAHVTVTNFKTKRKYITTKYYRLDHNDYIKTEKNNKVVHTIALDLLINRLFW